MRKWLGLVLALLMMVLAAAGALAATNSVNDARNGVVYLTERIYRYENNQVIAGGHGTAFFVGEEGKDVQYLVTCAHCVVDYYNLGRGEVATVGDSDGNKINVYVNLRVNFSANDSVEAYLVDYDAVRDIAVLRIENPTNKRKAMKIKVPEDNMVGTPAYAIGYPGAADTKDTVTTADVADLSVTTGAISRLITNSNTGVREVQIDAQISQGNSGGPLVNDKGSVIGICANGIMTSDAGNNASAFEFLREQVNTNYAVNIAEVVDMLKKNNVPYQMEDDFPVALVAVMAAVVVLLIVVIVVVSKKKGGKGGKGGSGRVLVGEQGALAGKTFELKRGQRLTVGRSTECQIRFPADTVGVSKVHCTILFDGEKVTVRDEKSTAGTYVDGNKVTPSTSVTLHRGQKLGIGSKTQILAVRSKK